MNARDRYADLRPIMRRSAARVVRESDKHRPVAQAQVSIYAELAADAFVGDGEIDLYWLYCYELASRLLAVRVHAIAMAGA